MWEKTRDSLSETWWFQWDTGCIFNWIIHINLDEKTTTSNILLRWYRSPDVLQKLKRVSVSFTSIFFLIKKKYYIHRETVTNKTMIRWGQITTNLWWVIWAFLFSVYVTRHSKTDRNDLKSFKASKFYQSPYNKLKREKINSSSSYSVGNKNIKPKAIQSRY